MSNEGNVPHMESNSLNAVDLGPVHRAISQSEGSLCCHVVAAMKMELLIGFPTGESCGPQLRSSQEHLQPPRPEVSSSTGPSTTIAAPF